MGYQESFFFAEREQISPIHLPFPKNYFLDLANRNIFFGTSSWKFRGWENILYHEPYRSEAEFQRECLREYTKYLPVVGVDFTYYDWPQVIQFQKMIEAVPENFRFCIKVTDQLLIDTFPAIPRYGRMAGQKNPSFLCEKTFLEKFWLPLEPYKNSIASIIFEFPKFYPWYWEFLSAFLNKIPREVPFSLELRNRDLCNPAFYHSLSLLGLAPALSIWTKMPPLAQQYLYAKDYSFSHLVVRALLPPGLSQEVAVEQFSPFSQIQQPYSDFYSSTRNIISHCEEKKIPLYVLVSNCLEGSAPLSLGKVAEEINLLSFNALSS